MLFTATQASQAAYNFAAPAIASVAFIVICISATFAIRPVKQWLCGEGVARGTAIEAIGTASSIVSALLFSIARNPANNLTFHDLFKWTINPEAKCYPVLAISAGTITLCSLIIGFARRHHTADLAQQIKDKDHQLKDKDQELKHAAAQNAAIYIRNELITEIVRQKANRVYQAVRSRPKKLTITHVRDTLDPNSQFAIDCEGLYSCISQRLSSPRRNDGERLLLAIYCPSIDRAKLEIPYSYNGTHTAIQAGVPITYPHEFALTENAALKSPCLARFTSLHGGLHVIPDCGNLSAADQEKFSYFHEDQRQTIRSTFTYAYADWGKPPYPIIMVQSNVINAFSEQNYPERLLRRDLKEFARRIFFEMNMIRYLSNSQGTS